MVNRSVVFVVLALTGCGAAVRAAPTSTVARSDPRELLRLRGRVDQQQAHSQELETQVALLTSETRELRQQLADAERERDDARRSTIRIGHHESMAEIAVREEREEGPRPVLRLVGDPPSSSPLNPPTPLLLPPPPQGVEARLPVTPIAGESDRAFRARVEMSRIAAMSPSALAQAPVAGPAPPPPPAVDEAVRAYRAALGLVEQRRFTEAYAALTEFLGRWPTHPYADNALYWRGEVRYAERQYVDALHEFEDVVHRFPDGNKTPEALLKIGLCHRRMGDLARAHLFFQRVSRQYPDTDAARAAAQEDAS